MTRVGVLSVLLFVVSSSVSAQDAEVEAEFSEQQAAQLDEAARTLFVAGRTAFAEARFEDALNHFERAHAISERELLLFNIAQTLDRLRRDADAIATFERFLVTEPNADIRAIAERRLAQLRAATETEDVTPPEQIAPSPEEVARRAGDLDGGAEPTSSSNTGLIVGVTLGVVVAVVAVVLAIVLTRDTNPNLVQGTFGDVVHTLRASP